MFIRRAITALSLCAAALTAPTERRKIDFDWGSEKIRGVNIGGWLVLEPWITPSLFDKANQGRPQKDIIDEYTLGEKLGHDAALAVLREHWNTFVTWQDFKRIKDAGFNIVRIPVGYWAYDTLGSPYVEGAKVYIDASIDWARSLGLKIVIDLHGAPGSQNGFDNSGQRLDVPKWQSGDTVKQTLQVLKTISDQYAQAKYQDVIVGIQLLNEPAMYNDNISEDVTRQFYRDGYGQVRDTSDTTVILHDGFIRPNEWNGYLTPSDNNAQNVAVDHHEYQIFNNDLIQLKPSQHNHKVCDLADAYGGADKWTFVGEWTGAMTDCAKYLNGLGRGARYDGSYLSAPYQGDCSFANDVSKWSQTQKDDTRKYIETQISAFDAKTQGWFFWNFKTENAFEWDALALVDADIFPAINNGQIEYKYPKVCTNFYWVGSIWGFHKVWGW